MNPSKCILPSGIGKGELSTELSFEFTLRMNLL
jgi:hypothetical protein